MKKVVHIVSRSSYDGAVLVAFRIMENLKEFKHVLLSCVKGSASEELNEAGINNINLSDSAGRGITGLFKKYIKTFSHFYKNDYDIIHYHNGGLGVLLICRLLNKKGKIIYHSHCGNISCSHTNKGPGKIYFLLLALLLKTETVIAVSEQVREKIIMKTGLRNIFYIHNFAGNSFCSATGFNKTVGHIGRLSPDKNSDIFLNISGKGVIGGNYRFLVKGDIYPGIEDVIHQAESRGLIEYQKPSFDTQVFYENIDLLIFTSTGAFEAMPLVILEAVANDIAVIAPKTDVVEKLLGDYPLYINEISSADITERIEQFYGKVDREQLTEKHRAITEKFSKESAINKIRNIYGELCR